MVPTPKCVIDARIKRAEQTALGEWMTQQKNKGREAVPVAEIKLVQEGIALGVRHAPKGY